MTFHRPPSFAPAAALRLWVAAVLLAATSVPAAAQSTWPTRETGAIEVSIAGEPRTFQTYAVDIPEDVAEGVQDPAVRERLEKAAGTTEHTATWNVPEPVMMGAIVLSASTDMYVSISARPTEDASAELGQLRIDFGLALGTLQLSDPAKVGASVRYYPKAFGLTDYYELTEGGLEVTQVERVDEHTLRIQGSFSGTFSLQTRMGRVEHNPADTLAASGTFDILQVVGSQALSEVLPAD